MAPAASTSLRRALSVTAPPRPISSTARAARFEADPLRRAVGEDGQVKPFHRQAQIGHGDVASALAVDGQLERPRPFLVCAVIVGAEAETSDLCGFGPGIDDAAPDAACADGKRTRSAAIPALGALEQRATFHAPTQRLSLEDAIARKAVLRDAAEDLSRTFSD